MIRVNADPTDRGYGTPRDPLGGNADYESDLTGLGPAIGNLAQIMGEVLVELRAQRPLQAVVVDGATTLRANETNPYYFLSAGKRIPSLSLLVQNNSGQLVYYSFSGPCSQGDFQLPNGGSLAINNIVDFISFFTTAANVNVRGIKNVANPVAGALTIQAWSNPEWINLYGQI